MFENVNLLIGIPAYNCLTHIDNNNTIISICSSHLNARVMYIGNESLITRGRNSIISVFYCDDTIETSHNGMMRV